MLVQFLPYSRLPILSNQSRYHLISERIERAHVLLRRGTLQALFDLIGGQFRLNSKTRDRGAFAREIDRKSFFQPTWRAIVTDRIDYRVRQLMTRSEERRV